MSTKTGITIIGLTKTPAIIKQFLRFVDQLAREPAARNRILHVVTTQHECLVLMDRDTLAKAYHSLPTKAIQEIQENLVEIRMQFTREGWQTPGVLHTLTEELTLHKINIIAIYSAYPTITIVVEQKDFLKAHEALLRAATK
jgi:aspartokinase